MSDECPALDLGELVFGDGAAVQQLLAAGDLVAAGGAGAVVGGVTGHASGGMSRSDLKELGDILDAGQAGLIAVYETNLADQVAANIKAANRVISRATDMGADQLAADMKKAEQEAAIPQPRTAPAETPAATSTTGS